MVRTQPTPLETSGRKKNRGQDHLLPWLMVAPAVIALFLLTIAPLVFNLALSTREQSVSSALPSSFVGFGNYLEIARDERFWNAMWQMLKFTLIAVPAQLALGLGIALLLNRQLGRAQGAVRALMLLPMIATPVAIALIWALMFNPQLGVLNYFLETLGLGRSLWTADPNLAIPALALVDVWQWTPLVAIILLAGLQSMPEEPFEAARIDGASNLQLFALVMWPMLQPTLFAALTLRLIDALKTYDIIEVITQGGPGTASETLNVLAFRTGFEFFRVGYASSLLSVLLVVVTAMAVGINLLRRTR
jgi:multiple sugar transport system permease protein